MPARTLVLLITLTLTGCGPAARPTARTAPAPPPPTSRPAPASAPAPPPAAPSPARAQEDACDALCAMVAQACHQDRGSMQLDQVTRCVKACVADRLPAADRRCYLERVRDKDRHARHLFCGHTLPWPRLRPGGCVPASADDRGAPGDPDHDH